MIEIHAAQQRYQQRALHRLVNACTCFIASIMVLATIIVGDVLVSGQARGGRPLVIASESERGHVGVLHPAQTLFPAGHGHGQGAAGSVTHYTDRPIEGPVAFALLLSEVSLISLAVLYFAFADAAAAAVAVAADRVSAVTARMLARTALAG